MWAMGGLWVKCLRWWQEGARFPARERLWQMYKMLERFRERAGGKSVIEREREVRGSSED